MLVLSINSITLEMIIERMASKRKRSTTTNTLDDDDIPLAKPDATLINFRQAHVWARFAQKMMVRTEEAFKEAIELKDSLEQGGGLWMVESNQCHPLINWGRGAMTSASIPNWSNETTRDSVTRLLWRILLLGGAKQWINELGNDADPYQGAAIHGACGYGSLTALSLLLECPELNPNRVASDGFTTPFMHCIKYWKRGDKVVTCAEMLARTRWYELDLDAANLNGENTLQILDALRHQDVPLQLRAAWRTVIEYQKTLYYPTIQQFFSPLFPRDICTLLLSYCLPRSLVVI